jgi:serine/threonine protein kinase
VRPLSQGGMGSVWVAHHTNLGIEVAVKFVTVRDAGGGEEAVRRFEREANVIARLQSPYVVRILDYGKDEAGRPYLAMELLAGESIRQRVERAGPLSLTETVRVVKHVCHALAKAHRAGIVHRDIKPANLFLCEDEDAAGFTTKVLDFGVAKMVRGSAEAADHAETAAGALVGTPLYMSPEQAIGDGAIDGRSDLYSLAMVAYFCLVGHLPFEEPGRKMGLGELLVAVTTRDLPPPSTFVPSLPATVDAWFVTALAKAPELRFGNARDMADAFAFATNHSNLDMSAAYPATSGEELALRLSAAPRSEVPAPKRRWLLFAAPALLLLAAAVIVVLVRSPKTAEAVAAPASAVPSVEARAPVALPVSTPSAVAPARSDAPPSRPPPSRAPEPRRYASPHVRETPRPAARPAPPAPSPSPAPPPARRGSTLDERQ